MALSVRVLSAVRQQHENGNQHDHDPVPVIPAVVRHGSSKAAATSSLRPTPMSNLLLAMVNKLGIDQKQYGDSTGLLV